MSEAFPCQPIRNENWPAAISDLQDGFAGKLNVYRVMAHHPALLRAWAPLRRHIVLDTALGPERSEVVILRAAYRLQSDYEWTHHVDRARRLGFSEARIAAIAAAPEGEDGLIVRAVDRVVDDRCLPPELEAELAAALGREAVFDLIATVGFYSILGTLLLTYRTPVEPDIVASGAHRPVPKGPTPGPAPAHDGRATSPSTSLYKGPSCPSSI
jgi:4-carboxymuconolactone decarboxylase